ncbi:MAG: hypothetical protein JO266_21185, partial [Acidobacteria bacterium]|nr:hypothetical protein [Acidobacteriota bacterium]
WMAWLPTLSELIFIVLLIALSCGSLAPRLLWDGDIGWHIRDGQNILARHTIPHVDLFSATMSSRPWYAWEWLYDALIAWIYERAGLNGVVFASALVIAASLAVAFQLSLRRGGNIAVTALLFVLCATASSIHFLARPHVVGWLFAVAWFLILDSGTRNELRPGYLFWLPILMLLWVNLHAGFVLGFVLLTIYLLAEISEAFTHPSCPERPRAGQRAGILLVVGAICFLSSLVNPYGLELHMHVYYYLTNRFLMHHINEFRRPDLAGLPTQAFLLMVALGVLGVMAARGRIRHVTGLLMLFGIASGMYAARNLPFASMLLMMTTAPLLSRHSEGKSRLLARLNRPKRKELSPYLPAWSILVVVLGTIVCLEHGRLLGRVVMDAGFDAARFPVATTDEIQRQRSGEPIFSLDSWGGYFIYRLYPQNKVFVDDRHDFYGETFIREYLKVIHAQPGWTEVLDRLGVNLIVIPMKSEISKALMDSPSWRLASRERVAVVFERNQLTRSPLGMERSPCIQIVSSRQQALKPEATCNVPVPARPR